uniref:(northern house mosquito) hypothetical protein n=1 Tax=Culex pipiens TaxID=7175 RepID=A0A8D8FDC9_CULPI
MQPLLHRWKSTHQNVLRIVANSKQAVVPDPHRLRRSRGWRVLPGGGRPIHQMARSVRNSNDDSEDHHQAADPVIRYVRYSGGYCFRQRNPVHWPRVQGVLHQAGNSPPSNRSVPPTIKRIGGTICGHAEEKPSQNSRGGRNPGGSTADAFASVPLDPNQRSRWQVSGGSDVRPASPDHFCSPSTDQGQFAKHQR